MTIAVSFWYTRRYGAASSATFVHDSETDSTSTVVRLHSDINSVAQLSLRELIVYLNAQVLTFEPGCILWRCALHLCTFCRVCFYRDLCTSTKSVLVRRLKARLWSLVDADREH